MNINSNIIVKSNIISAKKVFSEDGGIKCYIPVDLLPEEWLENIRGLWHFLTKQQQEQADKKLFLARNLIDNNCHK